MKFEFKGSGQVFDFTKKDLKRLKLHKNPKWKPLCDEGVQALKELATPKKVNKASKPEVEAK